MATPKDDKLSAAVAIEALRASRDPYDSARFVYFADETSSYWSVTYESLVALGNALDARGEKSEADVIVEWAEGDTSGAELGGDRGVRRDVERARGAWQSDAPTSAAKRRR
jgi:hypothetical protein